MDVLILGAAGMLGRKLTDRLISEGSIGEQPIDSLVQQDLIEPAFTDRSPFRIYTRLCDLNDAADLDKLISRRPDVIFHLAAVLSGEAEADIDKGYRVNLDGTREVFEAIRRVGGGYRPRIVFSSSIAVFGAPYPDVIGDEFFSTPLTSYGTAKAMTELLLADYSRRGFLDGVGIRLPTICVRPGKPNKAASGFYSNIIREPLNGQEAVLPVPETIRHWFASPRSGISFLMHAAAVDTRLLGDRRNLSMPGVSCTVGEQIEALRRVAGENVVSRIRREPDDAILRIVEGWAQNFDTTRANNLGFKADSSFEEIIRIHIEDELGGNFAA